MNQRWLLRFVPAFQWTLIVLAFTAAAWWSYTSYRQDVAKGQTRADALATILSQHVSIVLQTIDHTLAAAAEKSNDWRAAADPTGSGGHVILKSIQERITAISGIGWMNENGDRVASSVAPEHPPLNVADQPHFVAQREDRDLGLYIGPPFVSRVDGRRIHILSRRIDRPDGAFGGIVTGFTDFADIHQYFRNIEFSDRYGFVLAKSNGDVLIESPVSAPRSSEIFGFASGGDPIHSESATSKFPFVVRVSWSRAGVLDEWREKLKWVAGLLVAHSLSVLGVGTFIAQQERRLTKRNEELSLSEKRMSDLLKAVPAVLFRLRINEGEQWDVEWVSPNVDRLIGCEPSELATPDWWRDHVHPEDAYVGDMIRENIHSKGHSEAEYRLASGDGTYRWVHEESRLLRNDDGSRYVVGAWFDVTARRGVERALRESEALLKSILDSEPECVKLLDAEGRLILMNPAGLRMFEVDSLEKIKGRALVDGVVPEHRSAYRAMVSGVFCGEERRLTFEAIGLSGARSTFETFAAPIWSDESPRRVRFLLGVTRDVTELHRTQRVLQESLAAKETLLREIHHRVKNNLQIVSSLLYFQARKIKHSEDKAVLDEARQRLQAMVLVHEKLYQSNDLSRINFRDYLVDLAKNVRAVSFENGARVKINVNAEPISLPIEIALPCGMAVNELLTNCVKHAFPDRAGTASVTAQASNGRLIVRVEDDGCGFPADIAEGSEASFGLQLVNKLVDQLNGRLSLETRGGTKVRIEIPYEEREVLSA